MVVKQAWRDEARWYTIEGRKLPSVTTVLQVIAKPAIGPWMAKQEREYFRTGMLETLAEWEGRAVTSDLLDAVIAHTEGVKAGDREKQKAADIGTQAHELIAAHTRATLANKVEMISAPLGPAWFAYEAWLRWVEAHHVTFLASEQIVHCLACGFAGTEDAVAIVDGVETDIDYKSGKAVYPEAFLQVRAYQHCRVDATHVDRSFQDVRPALIIRLPKVATAPEVEVVTVPETTTYADFQAAMMLWRWQRRAEGKAV